MLIKTIVMVISSILYFLKFIKSLKPRRIRDRERLDKALKDYENGKPLAPWVGCSYSKNGTPRTEAWRAVYDNIIYFQTSTWDPVKQCRIERGDDGKEK